MGIYVCDQCGEDHIQNITFKNLKRSNAMTPKHLCSKECCLKFILYGQYSEYDLITDNKEDIKWVLQELKKEKQSKKSSNIDDN